MEQQSAPLIPERLERRRDDRMIAGVAAALARRLDLPVGVMRVLFVLTVFAGGLGLAAYLVGVLLIPSEHEDRTPARRWFDRAVEAEDWSSRLGWALMTLAVVILIGTTGILSTPLIVAGVLVAIGVALFDQRKETS
jgi:phage shock protein PspC (stress-responsive transcriptional regulator)